MEYREFGNTGIRVSEIGVGCGGLGGENKLGLEPVIERALDLGINFFDTCDTYAETQSEQTLGRVFRNHRREEFVICTKFGGIIENDNWRRDISIPHLHEAFEASRKRLNVDYFDVYLVHTPPKNICEEQELIAELDKMVAAGKIRCYGVSTERGQFAIDLVNASHTHAIEMAFSLFHQDPRAAFIDFAQQNGVGIAVKSPMAGGVLTDSFIANDPPPDDKRWLQFGPERYQRRADLHNQVRPILTAKGRTMTQGALAWLLTFPAVSTVLPGISSMARLEETVAAAGMRLDPEEMAALDAIDNGCLVNRIVD